jgi:hypothetical protein
MSDNGGKITVVVRIRPFLPEELAERPVGSALKVNEKNNTIE